MYRAKARSGCEARAAAQASRHNGVNTKYSSWVVCGRGGLQNSRHSMSAMYSYNSDQPVCMLVRNGNIMVAVVGRHTQRWRD